MTVSWTLAVDDVIGTVHQMYGPLPNSVYLFDKTRHVSFRALWAGQESLLRKRIKELLRREDAGEDPVNLGEQESLIFPMIHGAAEFDYSAGRGGEKSRKDFRNALGYLMCRFETSARWSA
jgi:hypothetical protein